MCIQLSSSYQISFGFIAIICHTRRITTSTAIKSRRFIMRREMVGRTGGVGMYILQLAKLSGASTTIAIGRTEEKLQMAQHKFGADAVVNITKERLTDAIKRITAGKGIDVVFDFVVNNESIDNSTKILANAGRLVLVGIGGEQVVINPKRLIFKEVSILSSDVGSKEELQLLVDLG
jgi:threonine dehydrogenase-like Zn-dependent dehydrogenase